MPILLHKTGRPLPTVRLLGPDLALLPILAPAKAIRENLIANLIGKPAGLPLQRLRPVNGYLKTRRLICLQTTLAT